MIHGLVRKWRGPIEAGARVVAVLALFAAAPALAQSPDPKSPSPTPSRDAQAAKKDRVQRSAEAVALHDEARDLYEAGEYRKAIKKLQRALELDPEGAELAYNIALIHEKLGDVEQAEQHYRKSLELEKEPGMRAKLEGILKRIEGAKREVKAPQPPSPPASASSPTPAAPPSESPDAGEGTGRRDAPWVVSGVVAVVGLTLGTSFGTAALARDPGSDVQTGSGSSVADLQADADAAHAYAVVADISLLVGTLATGLAVYFFLGRDASRAPAARTKSGLVLSRDGAGMRF